MAFVPGFFASTEFNQKQQILMDKDGNEETITPKVGKDVEILGDKKCDIIRKSDVGWEAAMVRFHSNNLYEDKSTDTSSAGHFLFHRKQSIRKTMPQALLGSEISAM